MANTYTQIHIQAVFAVSNRLCIINEKWEDELYKYISGIVQNQGHKLLAINGMPNHVHVFFGMRPSQSLSDLMQDIKGDSSKWINQKKLTMGKFSWQEGYGAFSYSKTHVERVIRYIKNQKQHHEKISFTEEYLDMLRKFGVDFNEAYIFKSVDYK
ncbi:MAG TPA: IS200/IS605 family transposase [Chitinophagaceae bacterium]|nr:IS200/IS605 family transposase [Chitinophagaceae bacterium]HNA91429.1 IS200/IS605 family transposase [Chitinophagaceae bacterium]HND94481.1 IS200/IS605 family transposase [Chitinophagaceae bacterium]HNF46591.1 IS200/IS605 family transposase [Chitinophagaceae bacterium]HNJ56314.1 IS200/IS605 family transposase [Chitinophagaceae bacterium]